jgi:hypothetical protein
MADDCVQRHDVDEEATARFLAAMDAMTRAERWSTLRYIGGTVLVLGGLNAALYLIALLA